MELLESGREVIIADNLSNSSSESVERIKEITGKDFQFYNCDIRDRAALEKIFYTNKIDCVIHFAGYKAVGESCRIPIKYYDNNICGTVTLCETMAKYGCKKIVFSSSATVYGSTNTSPLKEDMPLGETTNPYGETKKMIERILGDLYKADNKWSICILRYFNPIGAHKSGKIGENPNGTPNNLMPYITQVAVGKYPFLNVYGNDYPTHDGTGVRDYIHVVDLAAGHVKAVSKIEDAPGLYVYNLGTGKGYSVFDIVRAFEKATGKNIQCKIMPRRPGDLAVCYSDPHKAETELGWRAVRGLEEMCEDSYRWQSMNPNGFIKIQE